jgi:hypothetical protein
MKFWKSTINQSNTKDLLKEVNRCKPHELENLLKKIQVRIEHSKEKDINLLSAKTMITSRLASTNSKNF